MSREKQIEEMARLMCANYDGESGFCGDGGICDHDCWAYREATHLYDMGYRKATDVAEEISRDIIEPVWEAYKNSASAETVLLVALICESINAQLKKKYTEGEK